MKWLRPKSEAALVQERLEAAEEVCWTLIVMMQLGGLNIPHAERVFLMNTYGPWVDLAVETGILKERDEEEGLA